MVKQGIAATLNWCYRRQFSVTVELVAKRMQLVADYFH
jgi:hypothetical protein